MDRIDTNGGDDEIEIKLSVDHSFKEVHTGEGNDEVDIYGNEAAFKKLEVFLGPGNDTLINATQGSIIYGGADADEFRFSENVLIADAEADDEINYGWFGALTLTGGVRMASSDSPWAYGLWGMKYGVNGDGELVISDFFDREMFVANFNNELSGPYTAGIKLVELELTAYQLLDTPSGWQLFETFEALLGHALKALTGYSAFPTVDPLMLDLDGDGIELTARTSFAPLFDIDGDGFSEQTGWSRGDDGFLVIDSNGNGVVDDVTEMFGDATTSGFDALALLDENNDGLVDANDSAFDNIRVWKDTNSDAITDPGELLTLGQLGIESFKTTPTDETDQEVAGNIVSATGEFTWTNGETGTLGDILFASNQRDTQFLGDDTVSPAAATLPEVRGKGTLTNLRIAMTDSEVLLNAMQNVLPTLDSLDLAELRNLLVPIFDEWRDAVSIPTGTPGTVVRQDVPIVTQVTLEGGVEVLDFAFQTTDGDGSFWMLASETAILDSNGEPIERPTIADVLSHNPQEGNWEIFKGEHIQFMERYSGNEFPLGIENLSGSDAISGAATALEYMWETLNGVSLRIAMQGPLQPYFAGTSYDLESDQFVTTTNRQLVPMLEAIFQAAPGNAAGDVAHLKQWSPVLNVFLQSFDRGEDYLMLSYGFLMQNLVAAYDNVGLTASLLDAAVALNIPEDLVLYNANEIIGGEDADLIVLSQGNQTGKGGLGPDTYIIGKAFGNDVIEDLEPLGGPQHPDTIRFSIHNLADLSFRQDGLDLIVERQSDSASLRVVNQFLGKRYAPGLPAIDPEYGVSEIVFADGEVLDSIDIAELVVMSTDGDDEIIGSAAVNFFDSKLGNDYFEGAGEGDVYRFGLGYGNDTIYDDINYIYVDSPDIVQFKSDLSIDDLTFSRVEETDDLKIVVNETGDSLTIRDQFDATYTGSFGKRWMTRIESFIFENGYAVYWDDIFDIVLSQASTAGDDTIRGFSRADILDGQGGNDWLSGGNEDDTYLFGLGDGHDTIQEGKFNILSGGSDTLLFKQSVLQEEVRFSRNDDSLDLHIGLIDGATITVVNQFDLFDTGPFGVHEFDRIEQFQFANGTTLSHEDVMAGLIEQYSTDGDDRIFGFFRADTLMGGRGDDYLAGGVLNDKYLYSRGDGHDIITDNNGNDELHFLDIASTEVSIERVGDGEDALIRVNSNGESVTVKNQFDQDAGVTTIRFSDDIEWDLSTLRATYLASQTTSLDDVILAFWASDDLLIGGKGNDVLDGRGGGDTYVFNRGDGIDVVRDYIGTINQDQPDSLVFGAGISPNDVLLTRGELDLRINFIGNSDQITIEKQFWSAGIGSNYYAIESFQFADGTTWTQEDVARFLTKGTNANDIIYGTRSNDVLYGRRGDDVLTGLAGSDAYVYGPGDGNDHLFDKLAQGDDTDVLVFKPGISPDDIRIEPIEDSELKIHFSSGSGSILIERQLRDGNYGIEKIEFSNGVTWNEEMLRNAPLLESIATNMDDILIGKNGEDDRINGLGGNDIIRGLGGNDTLLGANGNDLLYGGTGNDKLLAHRGDDSIEGGSGNDVIFGGPGTDLLYGQSGDDVLNGQADNDRLFGQNGNDRLNGGNGNDFINVGQGDDFANGGAGNDRIVGVSGKNRLIGGAGNDNVAGGSGIDLVFAGSGNDNIWGHDGNDRLIGGDGNDILVGGAGKDYLRGGEGIDRFKYRMPSDSTALISDRILDFQSEDQIDVRRLGFVGVKRGLPAAPNVLGFRYSNENTILSSSEGFQVTIIGKHELNSSNFLFANG